MDGSIGHHEGLVSHTRCAWPISLSLSRPSGFWASIYHTCISFLKVLCAMAAPTRPLFLHHVEQRPVASFHEYDPTSGANQLHPFASTYRLLGESTKPPGNIRIRDEALLTEDFLYLRSTHEKVYNNLFLDQRKQKAQPPAQISANLSLRRKLVASKAPRAYESIALVATAHLADAEAPAPTSNHYEKPIDSQSYGRDRSYSSIDTIYCKCYPRLPAEH